MNDGIQKLIPREHVLPNGISKIIAAQIENGVDRRKVTLNVTQLILYAPQTHAQGFRCHLQKYSTLTITMHRGRNQQAAEKAVRESATYTDREALDQHL